MFFFFPFLAKYHVASWFNRKERKINLGFTTVLCRFLYCHVGASCSDGSYLCHLWCCQSGFLHPSVSVFHWVLFSACVAAVKKRKIITHRILNRCKSNRKNVLIKKIFSFLVLFNACSATLIILGKKSLSVPIKLSVNFTVKFTLHSKCSLRTVLAWTIELVIM